MNITKLARFLCGEIPNSKAIPIADFVNKLENDRNIEDDFVTWKHLGGSYVAEYKDLLSFLLSSVNWETKIKLILDRLSLPWNFIDIVDLSSFQCSNCGHIQDNYEELAIIKWKILAKVNWIVDNLKNSKNNKFNGNSFEEICEEFLLCSTYFEPWFQEFAFEDGTWKIDRILKLKKEIGNFQRESSYLWYVVIECKHIKKWPVSAHEAPQFITYIDRLNKYWVAKYWIAITTNSYTKEYKTLLSNDIKERVMNAKNPLYVSILTIEWIKRFLENKDEYKNMWFDEFIERSFIRWLK